MMEEQPEVYKKLREHLDTFPVGFPPTKSGVEYKLLKNLFTPEEAEIATYLKLGFEPVEVILERMKDTRLTADELTKALDEMVSKGLLNTKVEDGKRLYGNAMLVVGIYEYQVNRLEREFLENMSKYADEGFAVELLGTRVSQLRTVPVEESITPDHNISTFDEITRILDEAEEPISVVDCVCRKGKILRDKKCARTERLETCMGFGHWAKMYIDQGWAKRVTKEEALTVLKKNQQEGLIFQVSNEKKPYFICSCCSCCCGILSDLAEFPNPVQFVHANFYADIDREECIGCENCVNWCPMGAIKLMKDNTAKVNRKKCVGCGNCVPICTQDAIKMVKKKIEYVPPENLDELYEKILMKKLEIKGKK